MMKFPVGLQTFEQIRGDGYVYVDKTDLIYQLVSTGKIYFLSRPRRFGKSLLVSTLKNYFQGKKEFFQGLAIEKLEKDWFEYPVFHIDFNTTNFLEPGNLEAKLNGYVSDWEGIYGQNPNWTTIGDRFAYVLAQAHQKYGRRCVVLVDEYDKPILDVLDMDIKTHIQGAEYCLEDWNRLVLKSFYSVFKGADADLQFVLLTGVTKFSQVSVFSGFNQPLDISMDKRYEALCGITQEELENYFAEPIRELAGQEGISEAEMLQRLKDHYDGYHFSTKLTDIYNPYSLLSAFAQQELLDYWFRTGTPTYLLRLLAHSPREPGRNDGQVLRPERVRGLQGGRGEAPADDLPKWLPDDKRLQTFTRHFPIGLPQQGSEERLRQLGGGGLLETGKGKRGGMDTGFIGRDGSGRAGHGSRPFHFVPGQHPLHGAAQGRPEGAGKLLQLHFLPDIPDGERVCHLHRKGTEPGTIRLHRGDPAVRVHLRVQTGWHGGRSLEANRGQGLCQTLRR